MNPYKRAFLEPANLIGIAAVVAASAATLNPIPAIAGVVVEAAYVLFVPGTGWYQRRIAGGSSDGVSRSTTGRQTQDDTVRSLPPELQRRYQSLVRLRGEIDAKVRQQVSFSPEMLAKLDTLLGQFIGFASSQSQFLTYLYNLLCDQAGVQVAAGGPRGVAGRPQQARPLPYVNPPQQQQADLRNYGYMGVDLNDLVRRAGNTDQWAQWAVGRIQAQFNTELNKLDPESESDPSLKELKQKRVDVLTKRNEYVGRLGKTVANITLQLQLIEDTFGLVNDEVSAHSPDQVIGEIDNLMQQTDTLTKSLAEVNQLYAAA